ncbi:MAG: amino acid ABC transporter permease [Candidatus Ancillula sp.]|jgi:polar amino acid transport system permease protein|nr:amino acid ABC transporter permease [Candidatus Ancillula sp.]
MRECIPLYIDAAGVTVLVAFFGVLGSLLVGFLLSVVRFFKVPVLSNVSGIYIELARNTPLIVQLYFIYYGLPKVGIRFSSLTTAIIGLVFLGSAYMAESFRSAFEVISKDQSEAASALGMSRIKVMLLIILPQSLPVAVPSLTANTIFLVKETSVVSIVALMDLMNLAKDIIALYYKTNEALFMLVVAYALILLPISLFAHFVEKRVKYAH